MLLRVTNYLRPGQAAAKGLHRLIRYPFAIGDHQGDQGSHRIERIESLVGQVLVAGKIEMDKTHLIQCRQIIVSDIEIGYIESHEIGNDGDLPDIAGDDTTSPQRQCIEYVQPIELSETFSFQVLAIEQ